MASRSQREAAMEALRIQKDAEIDRLNQSIRRLNTKLGRMESELRVERLTNQMLLDHKERLMIELGQARHIIRFLQGEGDMFTEDRFNRAAQMVSR